MERKIKMIDVIATTERQTISIPETARILDIIQSSPGNLSAIVLQEEEYAETVGIDILILKHESCDIEDFDNYIYMNTFNLFNEFFYVFTKPDMTNMIKLKEDISNASAEINKAIEELTKV